ncbi:unnamed protein product [Linum tenue]|uniref:Uncharacterized protein n=1 Tax=Linum tenue TaxID=586396 RepID=A0AAV0LZ22_9ROSI|nr:unnamed protein product [Linum tenue]
MAQCRRVTWRSASGWSRSGSRSRRST